MLCPICKEHNQEVQMIQEKKDFYRCPDCDTEVWPPTRYVPTWGPKRPKVKGGKSSKSGRFKGRKEVKLRPWYQRTPE
jgi:hypothetical protein